MWGLEQRGKIAALSEEDQALILNVILAIVSGMIIAALTIGLIRARRADYRDIEAAEINTDLAAGHELLRDAMDENRPQ